MEYGSVIVLLFSIQINDIYSRVKLTVTCNNEKIKKESEKMEKNSSSHIAYRCLILKFFSTDFLNRQAKKQKNRIIDIIEWQFE